MDTGAVPGFSKRSGGGGGGGGPATNEHRRRELSGGGLGHAPPENFENLSL